MVHQDERPANGFVCGSFFALCAVEKLVGGAPSPTGRARAALLCSLHSPRGGPVAKNSAPHCFLNAPADGAPGIRPASDKLAGLFCYRKMFLPG